MSNLNIIGSWRITQNGMTMGGYNFLADNTYESISLLGNSKGTYSLDHNQLSLSGASLPATITLEGDRLTIDFGPAGGAPLTYSRA